MKKNIKNIVASLLSVFFLANSLLAVSAKEVVKIGSVSTAVPMVEILKEVMKDNENVEIEVVTFDGNHLPAVALSQKEINGVIANQKVWMETFNKENNAKLVMEKPYVAYSTHSLFSNKYKTLEEFPEKAKIAIAGDPSNMERSLLVLQECGLIKLGEKKGEFYNLGDITENPKKIEIIETEITATVRNIDEVDGIITSPMMLQQNGLDHEKVIAAEPKESAQKYAVGLIVNSEAEDNDKWMEEVKKALGSEEYKTKVKEKYGTAYNYDFKE